MLSRRNFVTLTAFALPHFVRAESPQRYGTLPAMLARMQERNGGRLGVALLDTATGEQTSYRGSERFPMCSTFKFLLASAVLQRVDRRQEALDRAIAIPPKPLLSHSPLTEPHAGETMTISALCHAVLTQSDNTAANLLLETAGGPDAITRFSRSLGDDVTRLDRTELALNESLAGDPRDTTSPLAMVGNLKSLILGDVLSKSSRNQLREWMQANVTGLERIRAKLPASWQAADKTGSNGEHTTNDIAVIWPDGKPPILLAAYITQCKGPEEKRNAMLAEIGRDVATLASAAE